MIKQPVFEGCATALITPFDERGIDYSRLERQLEYQYENGTAAVVVCGTTGENATLSSGEFESLVRKCVQIVDRQMRVIVGVGGNNTGAVLEKALYAESVGADAILMVTPYYNKTTQAGLFAHFSYVARRCELPMILYNVPSRTGIGIAAETYLRLSELPTVNGVKEASGDISLMAKTRALCGDSLNIWSGNDDNTVPMMSLGAKGVISVASNLIPAAMTTLCKQCSRGEFQAATELYRKYQALMESLFLETNPIPIKKAMELCGRDSGLLRLPLVEMSEAHLQHLTLCLKELQLI